MSTAFAGRILIGLGLLLVILGFMLRLLPEIPYLGRLPGDIVIENENVTFYFPFTTSLLFSLVLNLIFRIL